MKKKLHMRLLSMVSTKNLSLSFYFIQSINNHYIFFLPDFTILER